jgi:hypothetical protein
LAKLFPLTGMPALVANMSPLWASGALHVFGQRDADNLDNCTVRYELAVFSGTVDVRHPQPEHLTADPEVAAVDMHAVGGVGAGVAQTWASLPRCCGTNTTLFRSTASCWYLTVSCAASADWLAAKADCSAAVADRCAASFLSTGEPECADSRRRPRVAR